MLFRELGIADATEAARIEAAAFEGDSPWSRDVILAEIAQPHTFYLGAFEEALEGHEAGERMVSYGGVAMLGPREDPEFEIHTIGVLPSHQGRGIGRAMMDQFVHTADLLDAPMFLEVRTDNEPALRLYEAFGFFVLATRKQYYQPSGKDAYSMMRPRKSERETGRPNT